MSAAFNLNRNHRPHVDLGNFFKDQVLEDGVRSHLVKVYTTLAAILLVASAGSAAHLAWRLGGTLTIVAAFLCLIYLGVDQDKTNYRKRLGVAAAFGFFQGCSIGPLLDYAIYINPSLIMTALLGTATVFVCFSASAIYARRQQMLMLGGILGSAISCLFLVSVVNIFFRSVFLHSMYIYLALFIFAGFVLYDTQIIMERARMGDRDFIQHSIELFIDFVGIFKSLLVILMQKEEKDDRRRRR